MNENLDVFNSRDDIYLVFTKKSKFSFYFIRFKRFTVNQLSICFKPNHNNVKEDKGVSVTAYLDHQVLQIKNIQRQSARQVTSKRHHNLLMTLRNMHCLSH